MRKSRPVLWKVHLVNNTDRRDDEVETFRAVDEQEAKEKALASKHGWGWSIGNIWRARQPIRKKVMPKKKVVRGKLPKANLKNPQFRSKTENPMQVLKDMHRPGRPHKFILLVAGDGRKMNYFDGRDKLRKSLGPCDGSGSAFFGSYNWDAQWDGLTEKKAKKLQAKARRFKFVSEAIIEPEMADD